MNIFYLILFFSTNSLYYKMAKGMEYPRDKGKEVATGPSSPYSPSHPTTPTDSIFPNMKFSLVELSILVRILIQVDEADIDKEYKKGILEILRDYKIQVLDTMKQKTALGVADMAQHIQYFARIYESNLIENVFKKLQKVIQFYDNLLNKFQNERKKLIFGNQSETPIQFIHKRFDSLKETMTVDYLDEFFGQFGINLGIDLYDSDDDLTDLYDEARSKIDSLSNEMLSQLYNECINITLVEQNIFILWHLFGFARNLIRSFILFQKRDQMLMTLQEADLKENIIYPAMFAPIENLKHITTFSPLFYLKPKVPVNNSLNYDECVLIKQKLSLDPYTLLPRTPFYLFYYNITNNIIIKTKLEEFVIEPYFSYISEEENKETREYLHVNTVDLENSVNGNTVPPQKHTVLRNMIIQYVRNC
uniref:Uncharacterized protein n=1 Tax=Meloidogyne floridensis TaxID=298350 RepID=A0A915NQT3_9BILA